MFRSVAARSKLMLNILAAIAVIGLVALATPSRTQAQVSIYGGYSYLRASVPVGQFVGTPTISQNTDLTSGWEVSAKYGFFPFLGMVADFGGNYGTLDGATVRTHTYLFGPQLQAPGKISPFVHVLAGVADEQQETIPSAAYYSLGSDTSIAVAVGGGIDVKAVPFVAVRLIQVDYLRTNWHGVGQNQPRVSAGIVLHF